jgi:hypothetical protein
MNSANPLDDFLGSGRLLHVAPDGKMSPRETPMPRLLLPGSFNPLHRGHWKLAEVAEQIVRQPAAFELSIANVDKPALTIDQIRRRIAQFDGQASLWLTHAARFVDKAECFPGAVFILGADTALRVVSPYYYQNDDRLMYSALERIRSSGCRFLVACRSGSQGQLLRLGDLPVPRETADLFEEIPPEQFRWDLSSTEIRG